MSILSLAPREATLEAGGFVKGVAVAIVTQNRDPDGLGRVKVLFPWYENPNESYWARIAAPMAGKQHGAYFLPEIDQEVLVAFEREDIRFPYVIGALWNGKDAPPTTNSDGRNDVRMIRSRDDHHLLFNDGSDSLLELRLNNGNTLALGKDVIELKNIHGSSLSINNDGTVDIKALGQLTISAASITLDASGTMELKAGATLTIRGSLVQIN